MAKPSSSRNIRVLVMADSRFMRGVIRSALASDPAMAVVGLAGIVPEALESLGELTPDVVVMDFTSPGADDLALLERIMHERPTPIVMITADSAASSAAAICGLGLGAVDFVARAAGSSDLALEQRREEIIRKVKVAARVRPVRGTGPANAERVPPPRRGSVGGSTPCVVIAGAMGGPAALLELIPRLPREFPASIVVLQHMPAPYTSRLAAELAARASLTVKEAEENAALERGVALVCPGFHHLTLSTAGRISLRQAPRSDGECPSANLAMATIAQHVGAMTVGVLLSGLGRDGAAGAEAVRKAGGIVLAQDEASSLVYGMPSAAIEVGAVDAVVPLGSLAPTILAVVGDLVAYRLRMAPGSRRSGATVA